MDKLSYSSYVKKCVLGTEIAYVLYLIGGYLPFRTARGTELHHTLLETLPGFTWGSFGSGKPPKFRTLFLDLKVRKLDGFRRRRQPSFPVPASV